MVPFQRLPQGPGLYFHQSQTGVRQARPVFGTQVFRQMLRLDKSRGAEDERVFDGVFQFPNIAGSVVVHEHA